MTVEPIEPPAVGDVYAADAGAQCQDRRVAGIFLYVIEVEPEPDALLRVSMILNLRPVPTLMIQTYVTA